MTYRLLSFALLCTFAFSTNASAVPMHVWKKGAFSLKVPKKWSITPMPGGQGLLLRRNPRNKDGAQMVIGIRNVPQNFPLKFCVLGLLRSAKTKFTFNSQQKLNKLALLVEATFHKKSTKAKAAVVCVITPQRKAVVGMFVALPKPYRKMGKKKLLVRVMKSMRFGNNHVGKWLFSKNPKMAKRPSVKSVPAGKVRNNLLVGKWKATRLSGMMNRYNRHTGKWVGLDSSGRGFEYTFTKDGRYRLYYYSEMTQRGCKSLSTANEVGRYVLRGNTLTLYPVKWASVTNLCFPKMKKRTRNKKKPRPRVYKLFSSRKKVVFRGKCAPFMSHSGCTSTNGMLRGKWHDQITDEYFQKKK